MRPRLTETLCILALGATVITGAGGVGNAAPAGNDDRALLLEWQASCIARLKAAARDADNVEPGFSTATTFKTGLVSSGELVIPPERNLPVVSLLYTAPREKAQRIFSADILLDSPRPFKESGWRVEGPHGPLPADGEGAPEAELRHLYASRHAASGVFITVSAYKEAGDRALRLYRILRAAMDDCAAMMEPALAARIIRRGRAPARAKTRRGQLLEWRQACLAALHRAIRDTGRLEPGLVAGAAYSTGRQELDPDWPRVLVNYTKQGQDRPNVLVEINLNRHRTFVESGWHPNEPPGSPVNPGTLSAARQAGNGMVLSIVESGMPVDRVIPIYDSLRPAADRCAELMPATLAALTHLKHLPIE